MRQQLSLFQQSANSSAIEDIPGLEQYSTSLYINTIIPPQYVPPDMILDPKSFPVPEHLYPPLSLSINDKENIYTSASPMSLFLSYRHSIALSISKVAVRSPEFSDRNWVPGNTLSTSCGGFCWDAKDCETDLSVRLLNWRTRVAWTIPFVIH
ncbi:hypothetical protein K440DRAFT_411558 [Wilcoxina mikolae CBS 423.85]|nr:hypothetical protein K440DRAFT_411558 [Wilcoxina mikolae CBS 423.85]